jgi:hypothetical protein
MHSITATNVIAHAAQLRLAMALLAVLASVAIVKLASIVGDLTKSLWAKAAASGSGARLQAVGAR